MPAMPARQSAKFGTNVPLSATPEAKIALGLRRPINSAQLRLAIGDGSAADLVE
jgi:hypothetical protein